MSAAWFDVLATAVDHLVDLDLDALVGGACSEMPITRLPPPDRRAAFADAIRTAVAPHEHFQEHARVTILTGKFRPDPGR